MRKAVTEESDVQWWSKALNRSCFLFLAACRTPCNPRGTRCPLCVGGTSAAIDTTYFRYTIRLLSRLPNFDQPWIGSLRKKAVHLLQLPEGGRALDVGCGTGGSFPYLRDAVRERGKIVGVEISPDAARTAGRRIDVNHWNDVQGGVSDARRAALKGMFDRMILFGVHPTSRTSLLPYS